MKDQNYIFQQPILVQYDEERKKIKALHLVLKNAPKVTRNTILIDDIGLFRGNVQAETNRVRIDI